MLQILAKEDKLSRKTESAVLALTTPSQSKKPMTLKLGSGERFVLRDVTPARGSCKAESVNNVPLVQGFRKTCAAAVMCLVNTTISRQQMEHVQTVQLTQGHTLQMGELKKFVRQTRALRGKS